MLLFTKRQRDKHVETNGISQTKLKCQLRKDYLLHLRDSLTAARHICPTFVTNRECKLDSSVINKFITNNDSLSSSPPMNNQKRPHITKPSLIHASHQTSSHYVWLNGLKLCANNGPIKVNSTVGRFREALLCLFL